MRLTRRTWFGTTLALLAPWRGMAAGPRTSEPNPVPANVDGLTTGQYLTAVLLAVTPTALGSALSTVGAKKNPTAAEWLSALETARDTDTVNRRLLDEILCAPAYRQIITALRTPQPLLNKDLSPVTYNDGTPVTIDYASGLRDIVWNSADNLLPPWSKAPPHPGGGDLLALMDMMSSYRENH